MPLEKEFSSQGKQFARNNPTQRSRCRVFVSSHYSRENQDKLGAGLYDLSKDVIQASVTETFQGQSADLVFLPRRPYVEWIYAGDWVSVYLSSGVDSPDKFGVLGDPEKEEEDIRVFFGFVNYIRTTVRTGEDGATQVRYIMSCSGIQKAFDKTTVYYNPQLRPETVFGALLPGLANLMRGVALSGTPATIPRAIAVAFLGFGGQFQMPESYAKKIGTKKERVARILQLAEDSKKMEEALDFNFVLGKAGQQQKKGLAQRIIEQSKKKFEANSIAAVLDFFTYVRDLHVDGAVINTPLHDCQGSLWQLIVENSNPIMNECFLSLKPDIGNLLGKKGESEEGWKTGKDEWGMSPRYVPALNIRERPFSWVDSRGAGAKDTYWKLRVPGRNKSGRKHDFIFPDVFFSSKDKPVKVPRLQKVSQNVIAALNDATAAINPLGVGSQFSSSDIVSDSYYIDRVLIRNTDITAESLGMSDNDHFNFFMISQASIPISTAFQKYSLIEDGLVPIYIPESIKRYGLRVKELSTKFMYLGGKSIDSPSAFAFLMRTLLAHDMWYQHSPFYKSGNISTRAVPKARVGMALDIQGSGREESYYIEGVAHEWTMEASSGKTKMSTNFTLTRGQPGLSSPLHRFSYAPPDAVELLIGETPVSRQAASDQPMVERSPVPDVVGRIKLYNKILDEFLDTSNISGEEYQNIHAEIGKVTGLNEDKITPAIIKNAIYKTIDASTAFEMEVEYDAGTKKRNMPPVYSIKADRQQIGLSPWAVQAAVRSGSVMWDPIRRPTSKVRNIPSLKVK